jgi:NAD(P)-dependent dehydrogenase (short-subunit alcohol dehydrogenase family)
MTYLNPPPLEFTSSRLRDKVVFVTGASSGIGQAAVSLFAREGAIVVAAARRLERTEAMTAELRERGLQAIAVACDVRDEDSIDRAIATVIDRYGRLDGAFNNAGVGGARGPVHEARAEDFDRIIGTNLRGVFLCIKHQAGAMLKAGHGGSIVNTSSIGGLVGAAQNSIYAASKFGLAGIIKCVALDYARDGIRVNAIAPGPTRSEMFDRWMPDEQSRGQMAAQMPMNYIADPDDMARSALFLLSDEARWTTGIVLPCDGGRSAA